MPLSDIVNVQITRQTQTVSEAGFGTLMILGTFKRWNDLIRYYSSMQGVAEDFRPYDPEYVAAQAVFSQPITPQQIAIGRRQADSATIEVITAMSGKNYTTRINDVDFTIGTTPTAEESDVELDGALVALNIINVVLNGTQIGAIKSFINFDIDFVSSNQIVPTINGVAFTPGVPFNTNQATTLSDLATYIATHPDVSSTSVTGARQIRVNFSGTGPNTVDTVVTTGGVSQPVSTIAEGAYLFNTDNLTTMQAIAQGIQDELNTGYSPGQAVVSVMGASNNIISVTSNPNQDGIITSFTVKTYSGGAGASATITTADQPVSDQTIANSMVTTINNGQLATVTESAALITGNSTVVTLNGTPLSAVPFNTNNATTLSDIATLIAAQDNIADAQSNGTNAITIQPSNGATLTVSFATTGGASQPTWATVYANPINAIDNLDGTFTLEANDPGEPYTLDVFTDIINANMGRVRVEEANPNTLYEVTINGTLFQYTSPVEVQSNEQVAAALVALINADPQLTVVATDNLDGTFELVSEDVSLTFVCQVSAGLMTYLFGMVIQPLVASGSVTDDLDAIVAVDDNWYALACIERTVATVKQIAAWTEARIKIFGTASADPNTIDQPVGTDTTSVAAYFNNLGYVRTFVIYHQDADSDYPECAWFGNCLPFQPGSETWAFKTLNGTAYSDLSVNQSNNVLNKKANTYEYVGGVGITQNGTMAQGEYIDIIRGVDWLVSTIQTYVYGLLVNSPKVPYTDAGITSIEAQIRRALSQGVTNNFIAEDPEYTVTVPRAASVSQADKAARILRNVTFQATLAGAIQQIRIQGTVTV